MHEKPETRPRFTFQMNLGHFFRPEKHLDLCSKSNGVKFGGFDVYDEKSLTSLTITSRPTNCGKQQKRHQIWHPDRLFGIGQNYALFGIHTEKNCWVKRKLCTLSRLQPIVLKSCYILLKSHQKRHPGRLFSMEQNYPMF